MVTGYENLIVGLNLPDPDDRHHPDKFIENQRALNLPSRLEKSGSCLIFSFAEIEPNKSLIAVTVKLALRNETEDSLMSGKTSGR